MIVYTIFSLRYATIIYDYCYYFDDVKKISTCYCSLI